MRASRQLDGAGRASVRGWPLLRRNNLAEAYRSASRTAEAIPLFEATLKARVTKLGPDHPDTLKSRNNRAEAYFTAGRTRGRTTPP